MVKFVLGWVGLGWVVRLVGLSWIELCAVGLRRGLFAAYDPLCGCSVVYMPVLCSVALWVVALYRRAHPVTGYSIHRQKADNKYKN